MAAEREKWEYCKIMGVFSDRYFHPKLVYLTSEGEKVEALSGDDNIPELKKVAVRIAELGDEGWEMVGMGNTAEGVHSIYFKRKRS